MVGYMGYHSPDVGLLVILLKLISLFLAAISSYWRDIQHALSEFYEGAALDGDVQICQVVQEEVDELF